MYVWFKHFVTHLHIRASASLSTLLGAMKPSDTPALFILLGCAGALHLDRAEPRAATATDAAATWEKQAAQSTLTVEYLIVGGGGGGASGGGGGGGVLQGTGLVMSVDEVITVGTGGLGGSGGSGTTAEATNGGDSSIGSLVAYGGGKGAGGSSRTASSGGSGGGGAYDLPSVAYAAG
eukprot:3929076-Pyramimonas_sp.AAC.1